MTNKDIIRKILLGTLTVGTTLSIGFLGFVGMYVFVKSMVLCGLSFLLAAAYESQVNGEGIGEGLKRIFDKYYLAHGVVEQHLDDLIEQHEFYDSLNAHSTELKNSIKRSIDSIAIMEEMETNHLLPAAVKKPLAAKIAARKEEIEKARGALDEISQQLNKLKAIKYANNRFYKNYKAQIEYIEELEVYIAKQEKVKNSYLYFTAERANANAKIEEKKQLLKEAKIRLRVMQRFFLERLYEPANKLKPSEMELATDELLTNDAAELRKEIRKKLRWIRYSLPLLIGLGVCSGLATLGAMQGGLAMCASSGIPILVGLSATPFGIIVVLSLVAAIGYSVLMYQGVTAMIQSYQKNGQGYFNQRDNESSKQYFFRCLVAGTAVVLAVCATLVTAGTWWNLVKEGSNLLGAVDKVAQALQVITISMMVAPNFVFNTQNSVESVDKILASDYKNIFKKTWKVIRDCFKDETQDATFFYVRAFLRFLNPFRLIEKIISATAKSILFLGHVASIGVSSDGVGSLPPIASATIGATNECLTDMNYLPDDASQQKEHQYNKNHKRKDEAFLLTLLYLPITLTVGLLKLTAACWDCAFSPERDFKQSLSKMFTLPMPKEVKKEEPSKDWQDQEAIERNDSIELKGNITAARMSVLSQPNDEVAHKAPFMPISRVSVGRNRNSLFRPSDSPPPKPKLRKQSLASIIRNGVIEGERGRVAFRNG